MARHGLAALMLLAGLAGCAPAPIGGPGCSAMLVFDLFFGRSVPGGGTVDDVAWQGFQDQVITPNLPNGYTILDAHGAWMNPASHRTIQETTKVLIVALPDTQDSRTAVNRVREAYQTQFHQQLVGMTEQPGCGSF